MAHLIQLETPKPSNFDPHHPPATDLIEDCVHCGFCLPACPTYVLWGEEMDSPRGRIYMMKKSAQGEAPLDKSFGLHMDNCLGCMACMTACPSGVQYNKLIEDTRAQVERNIPRTDRRQALPQTSLCNLPSCRTPASSGVAHADLSAFRPAEACPRHRPPPPPAETNGRNGVTASARSHEFLSRTSRPHHSGKTATPSRRHARRMRPAGLLPACQRSYRARACSRRMRGRHTRNSRPAAAH